MHQNGYTAHRGCSPTWRKPQRASSVRQPTQRLRFFRFGYHGSMTNATVHLKADELSPAVAERLAEQLANTDTVTVGDVTVSLGAEARGALGRVFSHLAAGTAVDVVPVTEWLTTSEAAALLHVSRPTLVQMLQSGLIAFDQPGVHRRVSRAAVDAFLTQRREQRRSALDALTETEDPSVADVYVETR